MNAEDESLFIIFLGSIRGSIILSFFHITPLGLTIVAVSATFQIRKKQKIMILFQPEPPPPPPLYLFSVKESDGMGGT